MKKCFLQVYDDADLYQHLLKELVETGRQPFFDRCIDAGFLNLGAKTEGTAKRWGKTGKTGKKWPKKRKDGKKREKMGKKWAKNFLKSFF